MSEHPDPNPGWTPAGGWTSPTGPADAPYSGAPPGYGATGPPPPGYGPPGYPPPGYPPQAYGPPGYGPQYSNWAPPPQAPRPGIVALRPLGVSDILDGALGYIRRNPRTVLGLSAALSLVLLVLSFVTNLASFQSLASVGSALSDPTEPSADPTTLVSGGGDITSLVGVLLSVPVSILATGLLTVVVGQAVLGRRMSAGQAWRAARPRLWTLIGLTLLLGLIVGGIAIGGLAVAVLLGILVGGANAVVGILLGLVLGAAALVCAAWLAVRFLLAPVVVMLEKAGVRTALRRSARLVTGSWWRICGIYLLAQIIAGVVGQVLTLPFAIGGIVLGAAFPSTGAFWWLALAAIGLGTFVSSLVTMPFMAGVTALQYVDQRIRREALDIELGRAAGLG